jgi:hypothetical protein
VHRLNRFYPARWRGASRDVKKPRAKGGFLVNKGAASGSRKPLI